MNFRLKLLQLYTPSVIKTNKMNELIEQTANVFNIQPFSIRGLSFEEKLHKYAVFTNKAVGNVTRDNEDVSEIKQKLFQTAYTFGHNIRRQFRISSRKDALEVGRLIYRIMGIELKYVSDYEIIISECYFSHFYSCETCMIMSSLDSGLYAGLLTSNGLHFKKRITEGHSICNAYFSHEENQT